MKRKRRVSTKRRKLPASRTGQPIGRSRNRMVQAAPLPNRTGTVGLPITKSVGVVVSAMNEEETIGKVLGELSRLPLEEVVVVLNGSTDGSFERARQSCGPNGLILHYPKPLGYDVGRAVGAKVVQSDIVLFLDGDFVVPAEKLVSFIMAVERGADVALNNLMPYSGLFAFRDDVSMMKEFFNRSLGRPDLGINSLTAVPHALSRKAIDVIGSSRLAVPPMAHATAIRSGLRIALSAAVNVYGPNRIRTFNTGTRNPVARLIIGDHLEALHEMMMSQGLRLGFQDNIRQRVFAAEGRT